jgi:hypothetical protein
MTKSNKTLDQIIYSGEDGSSQLETNMLSDTAADAGTSCWVDETQLSSTLFLPPCV